jgi:hypothetical protein
MMQGYWWSPFFQRSHRGEIHSPWLKSSGIDVIENQGRICFLPGQYGNLPTSDVLIQVYSSGCYSSSCTLVYERTGQLEIDQAAFSIHVSSRFVVKSLRYSRFGVRVGEGEGRACTADCGGAGLLEYEIGPLRDGVYRFYIGETLVGWLMFPDGSYYGCLDTDHPVQNGTAPPVPYSSPTPYPAPLFPRPLRPLPPYPKLPL